MSNIIQKKIQILTITFFVVLIVASVFYLINTFYFNKSQMNIAKFKLNQTRGFDYSKLKEPPNITFHNDKTGHYRFTIEDSSGKILGVFFDSLLKKGSYGFYDTLTQRFKSEDLETRFYFVLYFNGKIKTKNHLTHNYRTD